jgi:hypothetical protein
MSPSAWRRLVRALRSVALWWAVGCVAALALATLRAFAFEPALAVFRPIDLATDIAWLSSRFPPEAMAFVGEVAPQGSEGGWRMSGMAVEESRFGESRDTLTTFRRDQEGNIERSPAERIRAERLQRGFPFRCVEGDAWELAGSGVWTVHGMWRIERLAGTPIDLPYRILWTGLLADGAIAGAVVWILACLPGAVEAALRRRRGRCGRCGQTLAGSVTCPECGLAAPAGTIRG